jgi:cell division inhibitor SulA
MLDGSSRNETNRSIHDDLIGSINQFSNLKTVTIYAIRNPSSSSTINSIMSYLEAITEKNLGSIQDASLLANNYGLTFRPFYTTELDLVQPALNVKRLSLDL